MLGDRLISTPRPCATKCYIREVKLISQRELRNDSAEVLRAVESGETFTVTRRGVPVALLTPLREDAELRCVRPATTRTTYVGAPRVRSDVPTSEVLDDLRGDR